MHYCYVGCEVMVREIIKVVAGSESKVDLDLLPIGLHDVPDQLRTILQKEVDMIEEGLSHPRATEITGIDPRRQYDAVLVGYCLCSNGIVGISSAKTPLVVPRGHDCVTMLLGSKERYQEYFDTHRGIYWYSSGWIERSVQPGERPLDAIRRYYVEKYGEDNAEYLMEMEHGWMKEYNWATYVDWDLPLSDEYQSFTRRCAETLGWNYDEVKGDPSLLTDFVNGRWDEERFLVVHPGQSVRATNDARVIGVVEESSSRETG